MNNRIRRYFGSHDPTESEAKCVIICDDNNHRVVLSCDGEKLIWYWHSNKDESGLKIPSSEKLHKIHPLAAEAYITEEIAEFMTIERLNPEEILIVNSSGVQIDGIRLNPPELGKVDFETVYKKEVIKDLYTRYLRSGRLGSDIVEEAITCGVLKALSSLANME